MPRISPLSEGEWTQEQSDLMAPMQNDEGVGTIATNLFTTLVRYPKLFKRWSVFANHVLFKSSLTAEDRELAILRIAWLTQADYEWGQHVLIARDAGMSDTTIASVKNGTDSEGWNAAQLALLLAVDQLHSDCEIDGACWDALLQHLSEKQILDLIFTVGNYRLLASVMRSVKVERDAGVPGLEQP
jgi:4-carboxymuconolactone decarboxylase